MELQMIKGKVSKDQTLGTTTEDRKAGIGSPLIEELVTSCSITCPQVQERFWQRKRHETNDCRQLRNQIEEAVKSGQLSHLVKGIKKERAKASDTQREEGKKDKGIVPVNRVYMESGSSREVIYEHFFLKLKPSIKASKVDSKVPLVGFSGEHSWPIGEVPLEIRIGDDPSSRTETLNFVIVRSNSPHNLLLGRTTMQKMGIVKEASPTDVKGILSYTNVEERVIVNNKYPKQTIIIGKQLLEKFKERLRDLLKSNADVFAWTHADMTRIPRTIMVGGKPFNTEHKLNEYSHITPIKQKRSGLGPDRSTEAYKEIEELMKEGILRRFKNQTWVANRVMVKKSDGGWRMCVDFTDINKACPKDCYPLPETDWKVESLSGFRLKCFLDAYKGYHQIQMAEEDEDKTTFFAGKGTFCYGKMPFG
ncbi:hypothetical protein Tco_0925871 [Tanacetum coccineum]|uniref:Reverse transcriptase domain-containing protein n=1 Tax=Tanacetum coccineum TaxID=301880 RepID=A0ABQ5D9E4_9ASTR